MIFLLSANLIIADVYYFMFQYLTKQTVALREVNDSRLRIYEQLEVNIQDLERANHRLAVDNSADKKHIKSLTANIEALELKCEHLQSSIDDLTLQLEVSRRKSQRLSTPVKDTFAGHTRLKRGDKLSNQHDDLGTRPLSPDSSCTHKKYVREFLILLTNRYFVFLNV